MSIMLRFLSFYCARFIVVLFVIFFISSIVTPMPITHAREPDAAPPTYTIALHGGVSDDPSRLPAERREAIEASLKKALLIGKVILEKGGSSLDAVEQVIRAMEDDPIFNAGRGAVFNSKGGHELDASIMDGRDLSCGAVAGVTTVKNPISLARLVMTETRHVLLCGDGAERFADKMNVERVEQKYFYYEPRFQAWRRIQEKEKTEKDAAQDNGAKKQNGKQNGKQKQKGDDDPSLKGTVGCVALDQHGNLAAGTSTGGLTNKLYGRIGDSPIIGAGTYADNSTCAVSCTGVGEHFIRNAAAYAVSAHMKLTGKSPEQAADQVIHHTLKPGDGGMIVVGKNGEIAFAFNTGGMARAAADSNGRLEVKLGK